MNEVPKRLAERGFGVGLAPLELIAPLTGLEVVEGMGQGRIPMPPMAAVLPIFPHSWSEGQVEFRAWPEARFYNPMGTVHGGWAMTMLDTAMGVAAYSTLKSGETYTSADTAVRFVRPIFEKTGELRVLGSVVSRGRSVITLDGRLEDLDGKLFAHGTSSCVVRAPPQKG